MEITHTSLRAAAGLCLSLMPCLGSATADAQPAVAAGFAVRTVAAGLDGPEGMALLGSGQIAVVENRDDPSVGVGNASRVTLVRPNGSARVLAAAPPGVGWADTILNPSQGFLTIGVRDFRVSPDDGIHAVRQNGEVSVLAPVRAHLLGIALDPATGDIYVSQVVPGQLPSIGRLTAGGTVSVFRSATRAAGLAFARDGRLMAAVQWRDQGLSRATNLVVAYDLVTGGEEVLASGVGALVGSVAVSPSGDVFVSDYDDGVVRRIAADGSGQYSVTRFAWGLSTESRRYPDGHPLLAGLSFNSLAFDRAGRLYISDYAAGRIFAVDGPF